MTSGVAYGNQVLSEYDLNGWTVPDVVNPDDGDLVDAFGDWVTDHGMRRKIIVDTPAAFYRFQAP